MKINYNSKSVDKIIKDLSEILPAAFSEDDWEAIINGAYPEHTAWKIVMDYLEKKGFLSYIVSAAVFRIL